MRAEVRLRDRQAGIRIARGLTCAHSGNPTSQSDQEAETTGISWKDKQVNDFSAQEMPVVALETDSASGNPATINMQAIQRYISTDEHSV